MHKTQKLLLLRDHSREFQLKCDSDEVLVIVRILWNEFSPVAQEIRHMGRVRSAFSILIIVEGGGGVKSRAFAG